jgi:hypothetical protein
VTDTSELDLSVLAKVTPPDRDEKPSSGGGAPPGKADDEPSRPRRRIPNRGARGPRVDAPSPEPDEPRSRTFTRDDVDPLLPDYTPGMFVKPLTEAYMTMGAVIMPLSAPIGQSIMQNAEPCARSIDNAAKVDKKFRAYLIKAMGAGVVLPILIAHMPIAMVIIVTLFPGQPRIIPDTMEPQTGDGVANPVSNGFRRPQ